MRKILFTLLIVIVAMFIVPLMVHAQSYQAPNIWPTGYWGGPNGLLTCTGNYLPGAAGSAQPCQSLCDLIGTVINVIYFCMSVAIFILSPIFFAIGAFMIMFGGANPGMLENGKKTLTSTVIGLVIIICSYLIVSTFITALGFQTWIGGFGTGACNGGTSLATPASPFAAQSFLLNTAHAQTQISPVIPGPNPYPTSTGPGGFVANFYLFALMVSGVLAFGAVVYGGILYLTAAGNPSRQGEGKEWIESALIGLLLLAGAYLILQIVNPALLNLTLPTLQGISISGVGAGGVTTATGCAGGQCDTLPDCTVSANVNCGGAAGMVNTLNCIQQADSNFTVSEGYPPTGSHISSCHNNGCCVDTTVAGGDCAAVNNLINAAQQCGATVANEYTACGGTTFITTTGGNVHINSAPGGGC